LITDLLLLFDEITDGMMLQMMNIDDRICPTAFWSSEKAAVFLCSGLGFAVDVIGHEWAHGIYNSYSIEARTLPDDSLAYMEFYGGNLVYEFDSGALNEAFADIIGESLQILLELPEIYPLRSLDRDCNITTSKRWLIGDEVAELFETTNILYQTVGMVFI